MKHPDYDIDFKPAIARYDWDQTYDVLEFVHLPQGFDGLMQQLSIPAFELMAIDRYTPYSYLWAEQYSDYVYNFLKQFNFSPHNSILERLLRDESNQLIFTEPVGTLKTYVYGNSYVVDNLTNPNNPVYGDYVLYQGKYYKAQVTNAGLSLPVNAQGQTSPNQWREVSVTVPKFDFSGYSLIGTLPITLTKGQYKLTCLINQDWKDGIIGTITTLNQAHYTFTLGDTTEVDLAKIIRHLCNDNYPEYQYDWGTTNNSNSSLCANSLVLSKLNGSQWEEVTVTTPHKFLFYQDIAEYFTEVTDALMQYFEDTVAINPNVVPLQHYLQSLIKDDATAISQTNARVVQSRDIDGNYYGSVLVNNFTYKPLRSFSVFPDYLLNWCYLQRANNNKWGGSVNLDLGITPNTKDSIALSSASRFYYPFDNILQAFKDNITSSVSTDSMQVFQYEGWAYSYFSRGTGVAVRSSLSKFIGFNSWSIDFFILINRFSYLNYIKAIDHQYTATIEIDTAIPTSDMGGTRTDTKTSYLFNYTESKSIGELTASLTDATVYYTNTEEMYDGAVVSSTETGQLKEYNDFSAGVTLKLWTQQEWLDLYNENAVSDEDYLAYLLQIKAQQEEYMVDSVRIKEIHACLGAGEASYYNDSNGDPQEVVMHLARKVDLLTKFCGMNFALDGTYNDHQSTRYMPPGDTIPGGWYFDQVGINAGWEDSSATPKPQDNIDIDQQRVGLAYEIRSNLLVEKNGEKAITNSGTILCNNFIQYIDAIFDDLDKSLDWQDLGTGAINIGEQTFVFEGLLDILQEILYQVTESNNNSDESKIAIGVTQQITKEILKAIGLPYGIKTFEYQIQASYSNDPKNTDSLNDALPVPYPATLRGAPTLVDILISIIGNLAVQNTGKFTLKNKKKDDLLSTLKP